MWGEEHKEGVFSSCDPTRALFYSLRKFKKDENL
jgi:hypothetical protein